MDKKKNRHVLEPIVRNLADIDFYKLTMLQFIWWFFSKEVVTFRFKNRTDVQLLDYIDLDELKRQLDRVTKMRFPKWATAELKRRYSHLFSDNFLSWLGELRLPQASVEIVDGNLLLEVTGPWPEVMLWETIAMCIVNRMYKLAKMSELKLEEKVVLVEGLHRAEVKFERLSKYPDLVFVDFSTRRRHSYEHQEAVLRTAMRMIPNQLKGTSNVLLGLRLKLPLVGTMAHELPMAFQVLFWDEDEKSERLVSQAKLWKMWEEFYGGALTIALPDTYGNDFGLEDFKPFAAKWAGLRHDSGDPFEFGEKVIAFYNSLEIDPKEKTVVFSDGLTDETMIQLWIRFHDRINLSFGWGTHMGNDMGFDVWPDGDRGLKALSIVMKLVAVLKDGRMVGTVKLSDNPSKASGPQEMIERIMRKTDYDFAAHETVACEV
ncbi:nicotinate phosphoribosyltransferase [Candidatus Uhrbacteria bacterium]|nr:nicotinate phosphoribosyltransferase [Candidatus Uhrbacteria bacterium]